ncbi:MAG: hypothetical protein Q7S08_04185 [bacterium]|nr:hypothetical protein [bacterium]
MKKPSAWIPIALSLAMLTFILTLLAIQGVPTPSADGTCIGTCGRQNKDEGVGAHLFQLWLVLEVLMIPFFAVKWLPRAPKQTLAVLAIQIIAVLATCFPVFYLEL